MSITRNTNQLREEVSKHLAADAVLQGYYWDGSRGCFIGCLSHSSKPAQACERFGLTEYILRIAERIFEILPPKEAKQFFADFPDAIQCDGKDLSRVHWQFLASELRSLPSQPEDIQAVIDTVITGMDLLANGREWPEKDAAARAAAWVARTARAAAKASARAAEATAKATERAAEATAWAADAARDDAKAVADAKAARTPWAAAEATAMAAMAAMAARAAARAAAGATAWATASVYDPAWATAWATAWDAVNRRQRDLLLRLIREAPVVSPTLAPIAS